MSYGDLSESAVESYREAGEILQTVLEETVDRVEQGKTHLDIAEFAENRITELGGKPAFPLNISVNEEASHASPSRDDETAFGEDMICLDIGVHVDGWIADAATTVDFTDNRELVEAADEALDAALDMIEPQVHTGEIGTEIEDVINAYGYNPVVNLTGHGLAQYDAHTGPSIPNRAVSSGTELEPGDVIAIEPFATTGTGKVTEGAKTEIYSLENDRSVRNRRARQLLDTIRDEYQRLPFAARWLNGSRTDMAIQRLETQGILTSYPVLKEDDTALVSQSEETVIVTSDGCEIITR
ncbi:MAG: type II methionyl aminopeptidase [Halobacteriaceae archaeon]